MRRAEVLQKKIYQSRLLRRPETRQWNPCWELKTLMAEKANNHCPGCNGWSKVCTFWEERCQGCWKSKLTQPKVADDSGRKKFLWEMDQNVVRPLMLKVKTCLNNWPVLSRLLVFWTLKGALSQGSADESEAVEKFTHCRPSSSPWISSVIRHLTLKPTRMLSFLPGHLEDIFFSFFLVLEKNVLDRCSCYQLNMSAV